jgi:ABC-type multidrug transport system fused ATPase/permease subunit
MKYRNSTYYVLFLQCKKGGFTQILADMSDLFMLFRFTSVLDVGYSRPLQLADLPQLPSELRTEEAHKAWLDAAENIYTQDRQRSRFMFLNEPLWCLLRTFLCAHGGAFTYLGFLKLATCLLSFVGPLLLDAVVKLIENDPTGDDLSYSIGLISVLLVGLMVSAILNAQYSLRCTTLQIKLRGALTKAIFIRAMSTKSHKLRTMGLTEGEISNMVQIDVGKVSDVIGSLHDLWNLPCLLVIAFIMLYFQVKIAFLAGVAIIFIMIPLNSWIASSIGYATKNLMIHKDKRVSCISDAIRGITSVKMLGLEKPIFEQSMHERKLEMKYLSMRKYLDAVCVLLWASTPVLVPFFTFLTTILIGEDLTTSEVFTTIALLNMLIFPMNAFPWVINGIVEGSVSAHRLLVLISEEDVTTDSNKLSQPKQRNQESSNSSSTELRGENQALKTALNRLYLDQKEEEKRQDARAVSPDFRTLSSGGICFDSLVSIDLCEVESNWAQDVYLKSPSLTSSQVSFDSSLHSVKTIESLVMNNKENSFKLGPLNFSTIQMKSLNNSQRSGQLICVCGPVGSGKSMLLQTLLRETYIAGGALNCNFASSLDERSLMCSIQDLNMNGRLGNASYCSQVPGMHTGSVRKNILLAGSELVDSLSADFVKRRYAMIFDGCCLAKDFINKDSFFVDTSSSEKVDKALDDFDVGQNGNRISGGQRLRVGVARALFAPTPVVLLDDPFSALDQSTSMALLAFIQDLCIRENRLVILSTHKMEIVQNKVDGIIFLSEGAVVCSGSVENVIAVEQYRLFVTRDKSKEYIQSTEESDYNEEGGSKVVSSVGLSDTDSKRPSKDVESEEIALETSHKGFIDYSVYKTYLKTAGVWTVIVVVISTLLMQITAILMQYWLAYWVSHEDIVSNNDFIVTFGMIAFANVAFALIRSFSFAKAGLDACRKLYERLTVSVLFTSLSFFERSSLGQIINRFGKETERVDDNLPFVVNILLAQFFSLAGGIIVISVSNYLMVAVILLTLIRYYGLQRYYRASSREMRRLESTYRSPLYTILSDCLGDTISIRATRGLLSKLQCEVVNALDDSLRVALMSSYCSQWLNLRLQLLGALITASVGILAIVCSIYGVLEVSPALLGLAMALSFSLVRNLNGLVNAMSDTEQEMISVERICEYCDLETEYLSEAKAYVTEREDGSDDSSICKSICCCCDTSRPRKHSILSGNGYISLTQSVDWDKDDDDRLSSGEGSSREPLLSVDSASSLTTMASKHSQRKASFDVDGAIEFLSVCMTYDVQSSFGSSSIKYSLTDITLRIPPGSRVALCGRTGSGKTSFMRLLLGMNSYCSGAIYFGKTELKGIPRDVLRSQYVGVIPQNPFLFSGSLRSNLDPFGERTDEQIIEVVRQCKLASTFANQGRLSMTSCSDSIHGDMGDNRSEESASELLVTSETLDSEIEAAGSMLSVGQKQLICLARCLLRNCKVVLVDEATSSLDAASESNLFKLIVGNVPSTTTVIIVCHTLHAVLPFCDSVIELEQGRLRRHEPLFNMNQLVSDV